MICLKLPVWDMDGTLFCSEVLRIFVDPKKEFFLWIRAGPGYTWSSCIHRLYDSHNHNETLLMLICEISNNWHLVENCTDSNDHENVTNYT